MCLSIHRQVVNILGFFKIMIPRGRERLGFGDWWVQFLHTMQEYKCIEKNHLNILPLKN